MWIQAVDPEPVVELFHNYENVLGICGKGSESGSRDESAQPQRSPVTRAAESGLELAKSHRYFSVKLSWAAKFAYRKEKQTCRALSRGVIALQRGWRTGDLRALQA